MIYLLKVYILVALLVFSATGLVGFAIAGIAHLVRSMCKRRVVRRHRFMRDIYMEKRIIVTTSDIERLKHLLESTSPLSDHIGLDALEQELDRAEVVTADKISKNVVTMN